MVNTTLITKDLEKTIETLLKDSIEVQIISAFFKKSSFEIFSKIPHKNVKVICGIDFCLTEPAAIIDYGNLYGTNNLKIFHDKNATFHTKSYFIRTNTSSYLIVGSSNLTNGGLNTNYEMSILLKNDTYSVNQIFENYKEYFNSLWISPFAFSQEQIIETYQEIFEKANHKIIITQFDKQLDTTLFKDKEPLYLSSDTRINSWIMHDTYGIGIILDIGKNTAEIFFLNKGKTKISFNNKAKIYLIKDFSIELLKDIFTEDIIHKMQKYKDIFMEEGFSEWIQERHVFYGKYREILRSNEMTSDDIYNFFDECGHFWTMLAMKKNILAKKVQSFNELLVILNDNNRSYYQRFQDFITKHEQEEDIDGVGRAIVSSILNILYPNECPVFNSASDKVLDFFGIKTKKNRLETDADKYIRYMLLCQIIKESLGFNDLVEVDCFVGFIKTKEINQN